MSADARSRYQNGEHTVAFAVPGSVQRDSAITLPSGSRIWEVIAFKLLKKECHVNISLVACRGCVFPSLYDVFKPPAVSS